MNVEAYNLETTLTDNGKLILENLPFQKGDIVKVIIVKHHSSSQEKNRDFLKGKVIHYDEPFAPAVSVEDWSVLQ